MVIIKGTQIDVICCGGVQWVINPPESLGEIMDRFMCICYIKIVQRPIKGQVGAAGERQRENPLPKSIDFELFERRLCEI